MKKRVAIVFGGKTSEHEVSVNSARNIVEALDKEVFEPLLLAISKTGTWWHIPGMQIPADLAKIEDPTRRPEWQAGVLMSKEDRPEFLILQSQKALSVDVAFPIVHGTYGEDGCLQGLFRVCNLPFVGSDVLGSSVGMDKEIMKHLLQVASIPTARYICVRSGHIPPFEEVREKLGLPFFIKPASTGSSVGVHKVKSSSDYQGSIEDALRYDHKVLIEEFISGRELECSVLETSTGIKASLPGEVIPTHEFYSYEAKYLDENGAKLEIPARLTPEQIQMIQDCAVKSFRALQAGGFARVDFFLRGEQELFVNEINTLPGFTKISMYPKMWEASGLAYKQLITNLVYLALERDSKQNQLVRDFSNL